MHQAILHADLFQFTALPQFCDFRVHGSGKSRVILVHAEHYLAQAGQQWEVGIVVGEGVEAQFPLRIVRNRILHDRRITDDGIEPASQQVADSGVGSVIQRQVQSRNLAQFRNE